MVAARRVATPRGGGGRGAEGDATALVPNTVRGLYFAFARGRAARPRWPRRPAHRRCVVAGTRAASPEVSPERSTRSRDAPSLRGAPAPGAARAARRNGFVGRLGCSRQVSMGPSTMADSSRSPIVPWWLLLTPLGATAPWPETATVGNLWWGDHGDGGRCGGVRHQIPCALGRQPGGATIRKAERSSLQ